MSFALSKIRPPRPRAGLLLARPALEQAIDDALRTQRAVLLCAAAGYGKTATLALALQRQPSEHALAWISVDDGDDLQRVLECLMAALEPFDVPWRTAPEGLVAAALRPAPEALPAMVAELVNALDACDVPHGVIAFDDLHYASDEPCLRFVDLLLQQLSPRWSIAITARHEPALRLARLRAQGELAEFREAHLSFSAEESAALLQRAGLAADTATRLHHRTAGWPAGLRLALSGGRGAGAAIDRQAFDFLAAEVLQRIEPALREFLLRTSVLLELDAQRCAVVSGDAQSVRRLEEVERLGLFASVVGDAQPVLRLHDLFRDALAHRLRLEHPELVPELLQRAASVEADPVRAQSLLLAAGQTERAARALLAAAPHIVTVQPGVNVLLQLCAQFAPEFSAGSAEVQRVRGLAHWTVWDNAAAEHHLLRAEQLFAARGEPVPALIACAHRAITLIALGRLNEAGALIDSMQRKADGAPEDDEARIVVSLARTWHAMERCAFWAVAPAFEALIAALERRVELRHWFFTLPPPRLTPCRGMAPLLARWADGAIAVTGDSPVPLHVGGLLTHGWRLAWSGRLDEAAQTLQRADAESQWIGQQVVTRSHALALRALLAAFRGDCTEALATIRQRLAEHPQGYGDWGLWHTLFMAGRVAASCADIAVLRECTQRMLSLQAGLSDVTPQRLHPLLGLLATQAWFEGRVDDAISQWRAALEHEEALDLLGQAAEVRVRLAQALDAARRRDDAAALLLPRLEGDDAVPGGALFARAALRELAAVPWGSKLSAAAQATLRRWATADTAPASPDAAAPVRGSDGLTARELEVLERMAGGASNKVIARALDLSPHTVKRHVANILDKLDVTSRAQAAAWWKARRPH